MTCPATQEAVYELEEEGHMGCPLCGDPASYHDSEAEADDRRSDESTESM